MPRRKYSILSVIFKTTLVLKRPRKEFEGFDNLNDPERTAERISKYVSKRGREDMNEWVDKEIKDDGYKEGIKKFANKLSEDKEQQDLILEQHN